MTYNITKFKSHNVLTKTFEMVDGKITKSNPKYSQGEFNVLSLDSLDALGEVVESLTPYEALSYSIPNEELKDGEITTKGNESPELGIISRTNDYFSYSTDPGFLLIDSDEGHSEEEVISLLGDLYEPFKETSVAFSNYLSIHTSPEPLRL